MAKSSKSPIPKNMIVPAAVVGGLAIAGYFAYTNNMFGLRNIIGGAQQAVQNVAAPAPPVAPPYPTPAINPFPGANMPGMANPPSQQAGLDYFDEYDFYNNEQIYTPYTQGIGTVPGTNPTPYPQACLPGYYRASDQKCYPVPTQFPGNGCETGLYLANDGKCYPYPDGGLGEQGGGPSNQPVPCPLGEYRASDGKCYKLPTAAPQICPLGWYMASDNKCYRLNPSDTTAPVCPTGYTRGADNICRASTACPTGQVLENGVCKPVANPCPTGYNLVGNVCTPGATVCPTGYSFINGVCTQTPAACPAGYTKVNNVCVPVTGGVVVPPLAIPIRQYSLIKILAPGQNPSQFCKSCIYRDEMGHIDSDFWAAVMLRPELSGGIPQFAVIIEAEDSGDYRDAMQKLGFQPLTPLHLTRYMPATGSFFGGAAVIESRPRRRLNNYYR